MKKLYKQVVYLFYLLKARFIKLQGMEWQDDLIWCPSQCYYEFIYKGEPYCIYLRWRWNDPWQVSIWDNATRADDPALINWIDFKPPFFKDDQLDEVKEWAVKNVKIYLASGGRYRENRY